MKSDSAIPDSPKDRFNAAVASIEDVSKMFKDFHPRLQLYGLLEHILLNTPPFDLYPYTRVS